MYRNFVYTATVVLLLITTSPTRAGIVPAGLNPGDQYQLVFVTEGARSAQFDTDINSYNTFVQTESERSGSLTENSGINWFVIGSTGPNSSMAAVDARDNAVVGAPVYLLDGTTKVADGFNDIWDGDIDNPINIDQFGTGVGNIAVFTGSNDAGFVANFNPQRYLGSSGNTRTGLTGETGFRWINSGAGLADQPFYALSELLVVPVPEPSLHACGMLALLWWRRRRASEC